MIWASETGATYPGGTILSGEAIVEAQKGDVPGVPEAIELPSLLHLVTHDAGAEPYMDRAGICRLRRKCDGVDEHKTPFLSWPIDSRPIEAWMAKLFYGKTGKFVTRAELVNSILVLEGMAQEKPEEHLQLDEVIEQDPLLACLLHFLATDNVTSSSVKQHGWQGTATDLFSKLQSIAFSLGLDLPQHPAWPPDPARLSSRLRGLTSSLKDAGITYTYSRTSKQRTHTFMTVHPSPSSKQPPPNAENNGGLSGNDANDANDANDDVKNARNLSIPIGTPHELQNCLPRKLEGIVGNYRFKDYVRNFINSTRCRGSIQGLNLLLEGDRRSGKTSGLTFLLQCLGCLRFDFQQLAPCGECDHCGFGHHLVGNANWEEHSRLVTPENAPTPIEYSVSLINGPRFGLTTVDNLIKHVEQQDTKIRIIRIDEAYRMDPQVMAALLEPIEQGVCRLAGSVSSKTGRERPKEGIGGSANDPEYVS